MTEIEPSSCQTIYLIIIEKCGQLKEEFVKIFNITDCHQQLISSRGVLSGSGCQHHKRRLQTQWRKNKVAFLGKSKLKLEYLWH